MGTHEGDLTGAEAFAAWAACSLDDCRDPVTGFDAKMLGELATVAESFAVEVRSLVNRDPDMIGRLDPFVIVEGGMVQNDPTIPVFDLDVFECGTEDDVALEDVRQMMARAETVGLGAIVERCRAWLER